MRIAAYAITGDGKRTEAQECLQGKDDIIEIIVHTLQAARYRFRKLKSVVNTSFQIPPHGYQRIEQVAEWVELESAVATRGFFD